MIVDLQNIHERMNSLEKGIKIIIELTECLRVELEKLNARLKILEDKK